MAAKKVSKKRLFMVVTSACGDVSQAWAHKEFFPSVEAAKKAESDIFEDAEGDTGDRPTTVWILEVVASGKSNSFTWK